MSTKNKDKNLANESVSSVNPDGHSADGSERERDVPESAVCSEPDPGKEGKNG